MFGRLSKFHQVICFVLNKPYYLVIENVSISFSCRIEMLLIPKNAPFKQHE